MDKPNLQDENRHPETSNALRIVSDVCNFFGYTPLPGEIRYSYTESLICQLKKNKNGVFTTSNNFEQISSLEMPFIKDLIVTRQDDEFLIIGNESGGISDRYTWFVASKKEFILASRLNVPREINDGNVNQNSILRCFEMFDDLAEYVKDISSFPGKPFICGQEIFLGTLKTDVFYIVNGKILPSSEFDQLPAKYNELLKFYK